MNIKAWAARAAATIRDAANRFPLTTLLAIVATGVGIILVHESDNAALARVMMTLTLGLPLSLAAATFAERPERKGAGWLAHGAVILLMLGHQATLRGLGVDDLFESYFPQHLLWFAASVLLVLLAPFLRKGKGLALGFWDYAVRVAYAAVTTFVYAGVIFAGIAVALLSVNFLFELDLAPERWVELWVVMALLFAPLFLLARYPRDPEAVAEVSYPRELRAFALYVLAPLVSVYLLILYSYTVKILLAWEWPKGTVSSMILGFSMLGVLTYALLYPLVLKEERLRKGAKAFFIALLPQVAVMLCAVWVRVSAYGVTEQRYLLVAFALWLLVTCAYFLRSREKDLRFVGVSLVAVTLISSGGPWGMFAVSQASQTARLEGLLEKNGMLSGGKLQPATGDIPAEDAKEISAVLTYLHGKDGLRGTLPLLESSGKLEKGSCDDAADPCVTPEAAAKALGVDYVDGYATPLGESGERMFLSVGPAEYEQALPVSGYDYVVSAQTDVEIEGGKYLFSFDAPSTSFQVLQGGKVLSVFPLKAKLDELAAEYDRTGRSTFAPEEMSAQFEDARFRIKLYFSTVEGREPYVVYGERVLVTVK